MDEDEEFDINALLSNLSSRTRGCIRATVSTARAAGSKTKGIYQKGEVSMEEKKITPDGGMNLSFERSPVLWKFLNDDSFIKSIMGPVGSGKSYACCAELFRRAVMQKPSPRDGIKYTRFAVVRNSYPMLKTTTLKTWLELFPEDIWGNVHHAPPIKHHIRLPSKEGASGIDMEVLFLALDQPKDVRKLLSLELTGAFVNESKRVTESRD